MTATLQKYRVIKEPGKPVGPHVDFARDPEGNILRGKPYRDETGRNMPGDPIERQYYPGDEVWSEVDLTQEMNGTGAGLCKKKFERVDQPLLSDEEQYEEAKRKVSEYEAKKLGGGAVTADVSTVSTAATSKVGEDLAKVARLNAQQRVSPESLNAKGYKELIDLAKAEGVDLKGASKKEDLVRVLLAALNV